MTKVVENKIAKVKVKRLEMFNMEKRWRGGGGERFNYLRRQYLPRCYKEDWDQLLSGAIKDRT